MRQDILHHKKLTHFNRSEIAGKINYKECMHMTVKRGLPAWLGHAEKHHHTHSSHN